VLIHAAVFAWGFTAILGRLISLRTWALVWWRLAIGAAALGVVPRVWHGLRRMSPRLALAYAGVGTLLALHFVAFYASIKASDASVAATCLALSPAFVALLEPALDCARPDVRELLLGCAMVPGVALVIGGAPSRMQSGVWFGAGAAALVAVAAVLNKRLRGDGDSLTITWLELVAGAALLTVVSACTSRSATRLELPSPRDAALLFVLAIACGVFPLAAYFAALRELSAFEVQLTVNLEPVYTVVLAVPMLGEQHELGVRFYAGVLVIVGTLAAHAFLQRRA
jgi:drug/metabolite transporter (DMT)-like permease